MRDDLEVCWHGAAWRGLPSPQPPDPPARSVTLDVLEYLLAHPTYWMTPSDLAKVLGASRDAVTDRLRQLWVNSEVRREQRAGLKRSGRPAHRWAYRWAE